MDAAPSQAAFRLPRLTRARTRRIEAQPRWAEVLTTIAFLVLLGFALAGPWMNDRGDESLSRLREIGYTSVFVVTVLAIRPWRHPERLLVVPWPILLALGWCWLSLSWALFPLEALRRTALTSIVLWSLFALVRELGLDRSLLLLRAVMAALLVVNVIAVLVYPGFGIQDGLWRGVMSHKNWAGLTCAVTILLFAFDARRVPMAVRIAICVASAVFLGFSQSKTSLGIGAGAVLFGGLFAWSASITGNRRLAAPGWAWLPFGLLAAIAVSMAADPSYYLDLVSDPSGFTGRTQIWSALIKAYADRPWLGVGIGSFWHLGPDSPLARYGRDWVLKESQGHNGYLDLLVQIGASGTLIVLFATLVWPLQRLLRGGDHPTRVLAAALLFFCLGHNFTESSLFDRDMLGHVFLMIAIALLWGCTAAIAAPSPRRVSPGPSGNAAASPRGTVSAKGDGRGRRRRTARSPGADIGLAADVQRRPSDTRP